MDAVAIATRIWLARQRGQLLEPVTDDIDLELETAYEVQREVLARRIASGERHVGWKIGYTSAAMREQMGVDRPNFGPLTDRMLLRHGEDLPTGVVQPRVEPEILLVIGTPPSAAMTRHELRDSCHEARCALEVVDPVWLDYRFRIEDNTADGSSAANVVIGPTISDDVPLDDLDVVMSVDGSELHRSTTAVVMGHPMEALRWLVSALDEHDQRLRSGDLVMTGGLTAAVALPVGSTASAWFADSGTVSVRRPAGPPVA